MTYDFIESIATTNLETKKDLFSFLCRELQKYVIGYIRNPIGEFEPAFSPIHSFMPLKSFGISDIHYGENIEFIKFPDGKSLANMLEDPINFDSWCKNNLK